MAQVTEDLATSEDKVAALGKEVGEVRAGVAEAREHSSSSSSEAAALRDRFPRNLKTFNEFEPYSLGQIRALTGLYVPYSLVCAGVAEARELISYNLFIN